MNIGIIQAVLDVFEEYGSRIRFDVDRFENALNDMAPSMMDECFLVVSGLKIGLLSDLIGQKYSQKKEYVDFLMEYYDFQEDEALLTHTIFQRLSEKLGIHTELRFIGHFLDDAIEHNNYLIVMYIAEAYFNGVGAKQDYEKAFELYQYVFDHADIALASQVSYYLGYMYEHGCGVEKDIDQALWYYAIEGNSRNNLRLGQMYLTGQYLQQDYQKAFDYFSLSHEDEAYYYQGIFLERQHHYSSAFQAFQKGAKNFHDDCLYKVGMYLYQGLGVTKDIQEAYHYLMYAYYCLHHRATYQLGIITLQGINGHQNVSQGIQYLKQAADLNDHEACMMLARLYQYGEHVKQDTDQALLYVQKARDIHEKFSIDDERIYQE